jgi:type II secretory pathway component PulL
MANSSVALATAILVGTAIFGLGYVWNAFRGARGLLKGAKKSVPTLRKTYWAHVWKLIKWGALAVLILVGIVTWSARSTQQTADQQPAPAPSASPR